jgi:SAM-dependent methyltransferase
VTYDEIGLDYSLTRGSDPRIAAQIAQALGDEGASVVNVGAGTGSYEPRDRIVVAVEPSITMIRQRPAGSARVIQGVAECLPLADDAVDSALAVLTVHHWTDRNRGFAEMRRVARRRVVVLTWDQDLFERFWLIGEYFPGIRDHDRARAVAISDIVRELGESQVIPVPVPHDCIDGFIGAFWQRPDAYLDPRVRSGISVFDALSPDDCAEGLERLATDIRSGKWQERHRHLLALNELDLGYRLVVTDRCKT